MTTWNGAFVYTNTSSLFKFYRTVYAIKLACITCCANVSFIKPRHMREGYITFLVILMILDYEVTFHSCPANQRQWESSPRIQDFDKGSIQMGSPTLWL